MIEGREGGVEWVGERGGCFDFWLRFSFRFQCM